MKKRVTGLALAAICLLTIFALVACGEPESKHDEIIAAYIAASYEKNPAGTEAAAAAFSALGDEYEVAYLAKDLTSVANMKIFVLFKCKTQKEANSIYDTYNSSFTCKVSGVDAIVFVYGNDSAPWDSVIG